MSADGVQELDLVHRLGGEHTGRLRLTRGHSKRYTPQNHRVVKTASGQQRPIGRKSDRRDQIGVPAESAHFLPAFSIPQLDAATEIPRR